MGNLFQCTCIVCGEKFRTKRNFGLYCSNAHRQQAYRCKAYTPSPAHTHKGRNLAPTRVDHARLSGRPKPRPNKPPAKGKK